MSEPLSPPPPGQADFDRVLIPVMGFKQCTRYQTGMELLWREWRKLSSPRTWILTPQLWDSDPEAVAALVHRNTEPATRIIIAAYSWGGGAFFPKFAEALNQMNRRISHAILCDPVYRSTLKSFRWLALIPGAKIPVPANVDRVTWFYQRRDTPAGHEPKPASPQTIVETGIRLAGHVHATMDESSDFLAASVRAAAVM